MGLFQNLRLLTGESLLTRMTELERRQELLEDYTDQKLDSMRVYSARVGKRERDRVGSPRTNDREGGNGAVPLASTSPRVAALLARRARRLGVRDPVV